LLVQVHISFPKGTSAMHISTPFVLVTLIASVHGSAFPQEQKPQGASPSVAIAQAAKPSVPAAAGSSKPEAGSSKPQAAAPSSPAPAVSTTNAAAPAAVAAPSNPVNAANDLVTAKDLMGLSDALDPAQILKDLGAAASELVDQATDAAGAKDPKKGGKGGKGGEDPKKGGKGAGGGNGNDGKCPPVWGQISKDLSRMFISGGQCNDDARASIRASFHDCFPEGGCDGSLALPEELSRRENAIMTPTVTKLANLAQKRGVSTADMIAFAGCKCS
jgi:hypothetical protein